MESAISRALGCAAEYLATMARHIEDLLRDDREEVREAACYAACLYPSEFSHAASRFLTVAREDPSERVRGAAISAVGTLNVQRGNPDASRFLERHTLDPRNQLVTRVCSLFYLVLAHNTAVGFENAIDLRVEEAEEILICGGRRLDQLLRRILPGEAWEESTDW